MKLTTWPEKKNAISFHKKKSNTRKSDEICKKPPCNKTAQHHVPTVVQWWSIQSSATGLNKSPICHWLHSLRLTSKWEAYPPGNEQYPIPVWHFWVDDDFSQLPVWWEMLISWRVSTSDVPCELWMKQDIVIVIFGALLTSKERRRNLKIGTVTMILRFHHKHQSRHDLPYPVRVLGPILSRCYLIRESAESDS